MRFVETYINKWEDLIQLDPFVMNTFIFRGQSNSNWGLSSSIDRVRKDGLQKVNKGYCHIEKRMILEFSRRFRLYSSHKIDSNNSFEHLALMQHYGAPTRLIDFTRSIFIASYFATENSESTGAIWAINEMALIDKFAKRGEIEWRYLRIDDYYHATVIDINKAISLELGEDKKDRILPAVPKIYSDRLSKQQGLFLVPTNSEKPFMENLLSYLKLNSNLEKV